MGIFSKEAAYYPGKGKQQPKKSVVGAIMKFCMILIAASMLCVCALGLYLYTNPEGYNKLTSALPDDIKNELPLSLSEFSTEEGSRKMRNVASMVTRNIVEKGKSLTNYMSAQQSTDTETKSTLPYIKKVSNTVREDKLSAVGAQDAYVTDVVYLNVKDEKGDMGQIVIGLFGDIVPKTSDNFKRLCIGNESATTSYGKNITLAFKNSIFHRIIPKFMIQGGDFTHFNGTGGYSVYGKKFDDENFQIHHEPYVLSMANSGENTNGSQFFITTDNTSWLDGKHVVFGKVIDGFNVVDAISSRGTSSGTPRSRIMISEAGLLESA